jgi:hypothetical protein
MSTTGRLALLELIWPSANGDGRWIIDTLTPADWAELDIAAGQHRLRPLLHDRARRADSPWPVPAEIFARWHSTHGRAARRALGQRAELAHIAKLFAAAGISGVTLKGASFVWRGWIDPALRPMRDLDILVDEDRALEAYALLRRNGFAGPDVVALTDDKHLPGLTAPASRVHVELHTRLIETVGAAWRSREAQFREVALRRARAALPATDSGGIAPFASTDALLHLIMHGVLDHQFNNGPLLLIDLATLIEQGDIDWTAFWRQADATGCIRACQLALRLADRYHPLPGIDWCGHPPESLDDDVIASAAAMMIVDTDRRSELGWAGRLAKADKAERLSYLRMMVRRRWASSGQHGPITARGPFAHRVAEITKTVANYAFGLIRRSTRRHVQDSLTVAKWLRGV